MLSRTLLLFGIAVLFCFTTTERAVADNHTDTRGLGDSAAPAVSIRGTRRALIVGISRYASLPQDSQLEYADDDAEMVYAFLRSPAGGSTEQAVLLLDEQATAAAIVDELTEIRKEVSPGDEIIFYFAGHGDVERSVQSLPGHLLGYDAPNNGAYVTNGGTVPLTYIREIMQEIVREGARVIIITDACRAGSVNTSLESGAQLTSGALAREWQNVFRFVSSDAETLSAEDSELGHGVFTYYLLRGLLGEADGAMNEAERDDQISHIELRRYVTDQVYNRTGGQSPVLSGNPGRPLSIVTPDVTWASLERFVPDRAETQAQQYVVDRGLTTEEREERLESLTGEQRYLIEGFTEVLQSGRLVGRGGAVEKYEEMRGRVPLNYFVQHGNNLATALENDVQALFLEYLSGEMRSDSAGSGDSLWNAPIDEIEAAAEAMDAAIQLRGSTYPTYPEMQGRLQFLRGWAAVIAGEYKEAIELLEGATENAYALNALGYAYYRDKQPEQAAEALARAVEEAPNWAEPRRFQGFVAQYSYEYDAAMAYYESALQVAPNHPYLHVDIGEVRALTDDTDGAMAAWRRALDIDAELTAYSIASFIMDRWMTANREELAESIYAEAMMRDPNNPSLHVDRGDLYRRIGDYESAEEDYEQARRLNPDYDAAYNGLGLLYEAQQRYDEAAVAYRRATELSPDSAIPWRNLGDVYREQERYDQAITAYERSLDNDPEYYGAHYGLGRVHESLEDWESAERHLLRWAELSGDGGSWNDLGVFYELKLQQFEDALRAYERGIEVDPEDPLLHANLGDARRKLGRLYEAAGAYLQALQYDPGQTVAIEGLERLEDHDIVPRRDRTVERMPGSLIPGSSQALDDGSLFVPHVFYGQEGEQWTILLWSDAFDTFLIVYDDSGTVIGEDDDDGPGLNSSLNITLPQTGQYTVYANAYSQGDWGDYEVVLLRQRPEGQGFGQAQVFSGELDYHSDVLDDGSRFEMHFIEAAAGEQIEVTVASDSFDAMLFVFDANGDLIAQDDDSAGGTNSRLTMTIPAYGEYSLAVTSYESEALGEYSMTLRRGIGQSAGVLQPTPYTTTDEVVRGSLSASNERLDDNTPFAIHDIQAQPGDSLDITMESTAFDTYLIVLDPAGNIVGEDDDSGGGTNARVTWTASMAGTYAVFANSYGEDASGPYTLNIRRGVYASGGSAPPASPPPSAYSGGGDALQGSLSASSARMTDNTPYERHTIQVQSGESLEITMRSSAFDTYLLVLDSAGNTIAEDDDSGGGTDSRVSLMAPSTGTLTIIANAYSDSASGPYTVTVNRSGGGGGFTPAAPPAGAGDVISGTLTSSSPRMGDNTPYEMHYIQAQAGESIQVTMRSGAFDTYLMILDSDGNKITEDDDSGGGTDSQVLFTAPSSGSLTIVANAYSETASGSYTINVSRSGGGGGGSAATNSGSGPYSGFNNNAFAASAGDSLDGADVVSGQLTPANERLDDGSYYAVHTITVFAGETLTFSLSSSAFDTFVSVYTDDGELLGQDDDSGGGPSGTNSLITVTAPSGGQLFVFANGYSENDLGPYTLGVERGRRGDAL